MGNIIEFLRDFSYWTVLIRILVAALMGGLIGTERGRHGKVAGLRTHILICIGSAMTSLTSLYLSHVLDYGSDVSRLSAQVISGIGFLGAGTILVRNRSVITGLTTAAGMWATAAIGIAVGYGFYSGAFVATAVCIISFTLLGRAEHQKRNINAYIELQDLSFAGEAIEILQSFDNELATYDIIPPKSGRAGNVGVLCILKSEKCFAELKERLHSSVKTDIIVSDINT